MEILTILYYVYIFWSGVMMVSGLSLLFVVCLYSDRLEASKSYSLYRLAVWYSITIVIGALLFFNILFLRSAKEIWHTESAAPAKTTVAVSKQVYIPMPIITSDEESESEPLEGKDLYRSYIRDICELYPNVEPEMVEAVIYHESRFQPDAKNYNGTCVGLMQLSTRWHTERANNLGVTDLFDPYGNILTGVDYLSQLADMYEDPALVLMMYHMRHDRAMELYNQGILSGYTKSVLAMTNELKKGVA